jgi:hypothetical protein
MGLVILVGIAIISATLWHRYVSRYFVAVFGATLTTVVLFQVAAYIEAGYVDPLIAIVVVVSGGIALVISALIGLPFRRRRSSSGDPSSEAH